ncbi:MAG: hypothetical protein JSW33_05105 [bacterium]|nr:MAG: hypothetical protein JSW33_05105 [bacterium]
MDLSNFDSKQSRRDFLKNSIFFAALCNLDYRRLFAQSDSKKSMHLATNFVYKYKTMSVNHFGTMQEDIDKLKRDDKLSWNRTFKGYIKKMKFELPDDFSKAKSVVILAVFTKLMYVNFHLGEHSFEVMIPPQYYDDGITWDDLTQVIREKIIGQPGYRIEKAEHLHLKLLAVRSGLGYYGRNNLCFVEGMGTFVTLYAFYTDFQFEVDNWKEIELLNECKKCSICYGICPTNCITRENFVIDVGKCITLYNEVKGKFPIWIRPRMHDALMGCMKCQLRCPENEKVLNWADRLEDITAEETEKILAGTPDDHLLQSLTHKLRNFYPGSSAQDFPIFTRNLSVLISQKYKDV